MIWCIDYLDGEELKFETIEAESADDARDRFELLFEICPPIEEISCVA